MAWLQRHPWAVTCFALAFAAGVLLAIAAAFGFGRFGHAWLQVHPAWLVLSLCAGLLAIPAYVLAYRAVAALEKGPELPWPLALRVVMAGFGPSAVQSGFVLDRRALRAFGDNRHDATVRVLGLGALEWALLAPAAWVSAVALLAQGHDSVPESVLWPWAIAVPAGFALALWLSAPGRQRRAVGREYGWRHQLDLTRRGVGALRLLARDVSNSWGAWVGVALYWAFEIACFYGAVRFAGTRLSLGQTVLAYATGFALTRRSSPLAGVGATEVLMTFSLHWVGQPIASALVAVSVYRVATLVLPSAPTVLAHREVLSFVDGDAPTPAAVSARGGRRVRTREPVRL